MRRTIKRNSYSKRQTLRKRSKGSGIGASKLQYPLLPASPPSSPYRKKPVVSTNNESLIPPKPDSKEYLNRRALLLKMRKYSNGTWINMIMYRKNPKPIPNLNSYGYPKSAFNINKVGFKKF